MLCAVELADELEYRVLERDESVVVAMTRAELDAVRAAASAGMPHLTEVDFAALNRGLIECERAS